MRVFGVPGKYITTIVERIGVDTITIHMFSMLMDLLLNFDKMTGYMYFAS